MFKHIKGGKLPTRGTKYSACVDVYANEDVVIGAGEAWVIGLGIAIDLEYLYKKLSPTFSHIGQEPEFEEHCNEVLEDFMHSHYLQLMLRSSLGKKGLILPNGVGIIDLDYEDEIKMIIHNPVKHGTGVTVHIKQDDENTNALLFHGLEYEIKKGDKIGQITLLEHKSYLFGIESDKERDGGFGSTDEC